MNYVSKKYLVEGSGPLLSKKFINSKLDNLSLMSNKVCRVVTNKVLRIFLKKDKGCQSILTLSYGEWLVDLVTVYILPRNIFEKCDI